MDRDPIPISSQSILITKETKSRITDTFELPQRIGETRDKRTETVRSRHTGPLRELEKHGGKGVDILPLYFHRRNTSQDSYLLNSIHCETDHGPWDVYSWSVN